MTLLAVLKVLAVLESTLPSFCFSYKIQYQEAAVTMVLAVSLDGGNSALVIGFSSRPILRPQKHYF